MEDKSIAYMNIAIIKYWCKDTFTPYLKPLVSSISLRSNNLYTITKIEKSSEDLFVLNGEVQNEKETKKIFAFVDKLVNKREKIKIISKNNMPTAAGLASSSSAYCALTKELNRYFNLNLDIEQMAKISTMGSGSAGRSFYNLSAFTKNGDIYELNTKLNLAMLVILVSDKKKKISSRTAMDICKRTSSLLEKWKKSNEIYFNEALKALNENDFKLLGENMEKSTLLMHETMKYSTPSFSYFEKESIEIIEYICNLRKKGLNIYFTADAGPNIKVLYQKEDEKLVLESLKKYENRIIKC